MEYSSRNVLRHTWPFLVVFMHGLDATSEVRQATTRRIVETQPCRTM